MLPLFHRKGLGNKNENFDLNVNEKGIAYLVAGHERVMHWLILSTYVA